MLSYDSLYCLGHICHEKSRYQRVENTRGMTYAVSFPLKTWKVLPVASPRVS